MNVFEQYRGYEDDGGLEGRPLASYGSGFQSGGRQGALGELNKLTEKMIELNELLIVIVKYNLNFLQPL